MTIYGIWEGNKYDGGGLRPTMYRKQSDAIKEMERIVKEHNDYWVKEFQYTKVSSTEWKSDDDVICVTPFDLVDKCTQSRQMVEYRLRIGS